MKKDYGKIAYTAYRAHSQGKSLVSGADIPEWEHLKVDIQIAWEKAAKAVVAEVVLDTTGDFMQARDAVEP